jgi:N-acetylmuramoyl-L-alanine amidase
MRIISFLCVVLVANVIFAAPKTPIKLKNFDDAIISTGINLTSVSPHEATLILDFPRETPVEVLVQAEPPRLILDLPKVVFPAKRTGIETAGPVKAFRYGLFIAGRSRVVIDLDGAALVERVDPVQVDGGTRVVVMIKRVEAQVFALAVRESAANIRYTGTVKNANLVQSEKVDAPKNELPLVVLDPGHGGIDPGASGPHGELEKHLVLKIAQLLKTKLEATGKVRVELTREADVFVQLSDRVKLARTKSAALFVSLHADTLHNEPNVRGATIYTLSDKASDAGAAQLADKENKVDQLAGITDSDDRDTVSDILFDLARRETRVFSLDFAKVLVAKIQDYQAQGLTMIAKNPHRYASFKVLKAPDVPSVLFELGYLSSAEDAKDLNSPQWQGKLTDAASDAIARFVVGRGR